MENTLMDAMNDSTENHNANEQQQLVQERLTLGQYLRTEREKRKLSIEELHAKTGINLSSLHALEHDLRQELPADVFVRGFIKLYAKTLDLDPQHALSLLKGKVSSSQKTPESITSRDLLSSESLAESSLFTRKKLLLCFLLIIFVILAFIVFRYHPMAGLDIFPVNFSQPTDSPEESKKAPPSLQLIAPVVPEALQEQEGEKTAQDLSSSLPGQSERLPPTASETPGGGSSEVIDSKGTGESEPSPPVENSIKAAGEKPGAQSSHTLTATFSEMTWVRTVLDHGEVKEAFFRPGSSASWQAKEEIEILLGNSGGASLVFDGTPVKLKGSTDKVIRLTFP